MKNILLIDDDEAVRLSVAFLLQSNGFTVVTAANGREGLRRCDEQRPDLVITDIMMPEIDGIETIMTLRQAFPEIPIVAMSGGWHPGDVRLLSMVAKLGATETLAKPFDCDQLLAVIHACDQNHAVPTLTNREPLSQILDDRRFACLVKRHADTPAVGR
jgi:two-component system, chemotaxis family, chemotaxis protein CheY